MKKEKVLSTFIGGVKTDFKLCQNGKKRWMEFPPSLTICDDSDANDVVEMIQTVLSFLEDDMDLEEM